MTLDEMAVREALAGLSGWMGDTASISKTYEFPSFAEAVLGVAAVAVAAERADHHPDIDIRWRSVTFRLATHSAGGVTAKDLGLAADIDDTLGK